MSSNITLNANISSNSVHMNVDTTPVTTTLSMRNVIVGYDKSYVYTQSVSSKEWHIFHDLGKYPSVTIIDSAGTVVIGQVQYASQNEIVLHFSAPFSGKAFFN